MERDALVSSHGRSVLAGPYLQNAFVITSVLSRESLVVEPVYGQLKDVRIVLFQLDHLVFGFAEFSGESGAEEFRVVDKQVFIDEKANLVGLYENRGERRFRSSASGLQLEAYEEGELHLRDTWSRQLCFRRWSGASTGRYPDKQWLVAIAVVCGCKIESVVRYNLENASGVEKLLQVKVRLTVNLDKNLDSEVK
jgi:hypothetical protein